MEGSDIFNSDWLSCDCSCLTTVSSQPCPNFKKLQAFYILGKLYTEHLGFAKFTHMKWINEQPSHPTQFDYTEEGGLL